MGFLLNLCISIFFRTFVAVKQLFTIAFFLICGLVAHAQQAGASQPGGLFLYSEFQQGMVYFLDGTRSTALMNYNFTAREMQFIDPQQGGQIMNVVRHPDLSHIQINDDIFVPIANAGYALVILDGPVALLKKQNITSRRVVRGAFGIPTETIRVGEVPFGTSTGEFQEVSAMHNAPDFETNYRTEITFFLMKDRNVQAANRRNFLRFYREVRPQLEAFMRENSIDFRDEQHLRGLTRFANSLLLTYSATTPQSS